MPSRERKEYYFSKLDECFDNNARAFLVGVDNVGSKQLQDIRVQLRGTAEVLMGKNTMIRRFIRNSGKAELECILPVMKGNLGFVFTNETLSGVRDVIMENRVPAMAKAGVLAPIDVFVPAGPTGLDPAQTSFFQALNVPTKINKGTIEILSEVHVVHAGTRVGGSEAALLVKLGIKPFSYGLEIKHVFEGGAVFDPSVMDITDATLMAKFAAAVSNVAATCLAVGYPTAASFPHTFMSAFKDLAAVSIAVDYDFPEIEKVKEILANPEAFMAAAAAAAPQAAAGGAAPAAAAKKAPEPEPEESDEDMGFGLFD